MRRILIAAVLCALASFVLMSGSAQAAVNIAPARSGATPAAKKAPKGTKYELCQEVEEGFACENVLLYKKTHTWEFENFANDGGIFEKSGKVIAFEYTENFNTGSLIFLEKIKKIYYGHLYYWDGEEFIEEPYLVELRKAPKA